MASTGHREDGDEKKEDEKRKREDDSMTGSSVMKKRRRAEESGLEDEELTSDSSQGSATSSPYANLTISRFTIHRSWGAAALANHFISCWVDEHSPLVLLASVPGQKVYTAIKIISKKYEQCRYHHERAADTPGGPRLPIHMPPLCQEQAYFIKEYLSGGSLEDLINLCSYMNISSMRFYTAEMVCGLQFLHGHNIVHRDLKTQNIMLDADGHIRIIDFGLAQDGVTASNKIRGVMGTMH